MAERPEDLNLPNAVVSRIIKEALPDGVIVAKDSRVAISKAASVFVLYATSCANNFALQHKRKTISGKDVLDAMEEMEFEKFVEPLKKSLEAYKLEQKNKKESSANRKKELAEQKELAAGGGDGKENDSVTVEDDDDDDDEVQLVENEEEEEEEGAES